MKIFYLIILIIGLVFIGYSFTLEPFKNYDLFHEKYMELDDNITSKNKSTLYFELRKKHLTNKYYFFDYGCILAILSLFSLYIFRKNYDLKTFNTNLKIVFVGFFAFLMTLIAVYTHLFIDYDRECFPNWADSLGIPMFYLGNFSIYVLVWWLINLIGFFKNFKPNQKIKNYAFNFKNFFSYFYGLQLLVTIILLSIFIYDGAFLYVIALLLWTTFYYSTLLGKSK